MRKMEIFLITSGENNAQIKKGLTGKAKARK
jgi:hypothetical protein